VNTKGYVLCEERKEKEKQLSAPYKSEVEKRAVPATAVFRRTSDDRSGVGSAQLEAFAL
jgi:hypothetical protein